MDPQLYFMVIGTVMTPIAGKLADIYGKKKVLLIILTVYSGLHLIYFHKKMQNIQCADCGCYPEDCKDSISPQTCPNCSWKKCCCWDYLH